MSNAKQYKDAFDSYTKSSIGKQQSAPLNENYTGTPVESANSEQKVIVTNNVFSHSHVDVAGQIPVPVVGKNSWKIEKNLPIYNSVEDKKIADLERKIENLEAYRNAAESNNNQGNVNRSGPLTYTSIQKDDYHFLWYKCDETNTEFEDNGKAFMDSINPGDPNRKLSQINGLNGPLYAAKNGNGSYAQGVQLDTNVFGNSRRPTVASAGYYTGSIDTQGDSFLTNGLSFEITYKKLRSDMNDSVAPLISIQNVSQTGNVRRVTFYLNGTNGKLQLGYNGVSDSNISDLATVVINSTNHSMFTLKPNISGDQVLSADLRVYHNGVLTCYTINNNPFGRGLFQNWNDNLKSFEKFKIYLFRGLYNSPNILAGVSDVRLSNTIRDAEYAKRAYADALRL